MAIGTDKAGMKRHCGIGPGMHKKCKLCPCEGRGRYRKGTPLMSEDG
jgi:hypothetical protein